MNCADMLLHFFGGPMKGHKGSHPGYATFKQNNPGTSLTQI
jgi:hypothetical protein